MTHDAARDKRLREMTREEFVEAMPWFVRKLIIAQGFDPLDVTEWELILPPGEDDCTLSIKVMPEVDQVKMSFTKADAERL